jgi:hypothetical protein
MLRTYLRNSIWDYLLLVVMACCFARTALSGFYTPAYLYGNIGLLIIMSASLCALLLFGAYSKRSVVITIIAFAVCFVAFIILVRASGAGNVFADTERNPYLYFVLVALTSVGVFLLSRTKVGCIALFAAGAVVLCMVRFLYEVDHLIEFMLFLLAAGTMYIYRNDRGSVLSSRAIRPVFGHTTATGAVLCVLVIGMGCGIFFGIVKPLDPPARDLKLITKYLSLPTLEKIGVAELTEMPDDNLSSNKTSDEEQSAKADGDKPEDTPSDADKDSDQDTEDKTNPLALDSSRNPFFKVIDYLAEKLGIFTIPIIIAVIIAALIFGKLYRRRRWLALLSARSCDEQVREMYSYYMKKLGFIKVRKPPEDTLFEFAERTRPILERFDAPEASFRDLTDIYIKSCYGTESATGEEVAKYRRFHDKFYANCRAYLGGFGYTIRFFRI